MDGLHEDLNRVKVKPYTETIESDGRPDEIVSRASWFNHLKRNNSIITDLMHGQYKSKITCPDCGHVSITFDPFLTCTLPLPTKERKKIDFYFIFADNHIIPVKVEIWFKKRNHYISNLKEQVIEELKNIRALTSKSFNFYFLSNTSLSKVTAGTPTNEVSKKRKMGNIFAVEMDSNLLSHNEADIVEVPITFSKKEHYYSSYYTKRPITFVRPMHFLRTDSTNDMHFRIFKYFRFFFEELFQNPEDKEEFLKLNDLEAYAKLFGKPDERPYEVLLQTNARSYLSCYYCGEYRCDNCKLSEKDDETLDDILKKIKSKDFGFELEVYWPNPSIYEHHDIGARFHKCEDLKKMEKVEEKKEEAVAAVETDTKSVETPIEEEQKSSEFKNKKPYIITKNLVSDDKNAEGDEKSLSECFNLFSEPETLNAENAWYCSKCKSHKEANKEMKIYKSPQYLILHLKRFKGGESILSAGKISTKINFPVILDLTNLVMNHELPTEYLSMETPSLVEKTDNMEEEKNSNLEEIDLGDGKMINEDEQINKEKVSAEVEKIDAEPMIIESPAETKEKKQLLYRLYAISNHYGSVGFGHYTAFAFHPKDNSWYCFDDSSVSKVTEDQIVTSAAYILFYERFNPDCPDDKPLDFDIKVEQSNAPVQSNTNETVQQVDLGNVNGNQSTAEQNISSYLESGSTGNQAMEGGNKAAFEE